MRNFIIAGALAFSFAGNSSFAQSDREDYWEMGFSVLDLSDVNASGLNGSALDVNGTTGFGFSGAYNFSERLALGLDLNYANPSYRATLVPDGSGEPEVIRAKLDTSTVQFKGIFNLLEADFTPFVELGIGWTYLDSNIVSGISGPTCWWDPWWGYICNNYYDTYSETRTSLSYALGVRWDINSDYVFRASWGVLDIDTDRSEDIEVDTLQLTFMWKF